jgi:hypothetical protein
LEANAWVRYIRQGEKADINSQFVQPQPPFLSGLRSDFTYIGFDFRYELLHELTAKVRYEFYKSSRQLKDFSLVNKNINDFQFSVYYGL